MIKILFGSGVGLLALTHFQPSYASDASGVPIVDFMVEQL